MENALSANHLTRDPIATARLHSVLRFSTGVTAAFILSEAMGWVPTFLPPVLLAVLLANLPFAPPFKVGFTLFVVVAGGAMIAFVLSSLLREMPQILIGTVALVVFLAFVTMAHGRAKLPATLVLLCISTIPIIAIIAPTHAELLPIAFVRGMAVAMLILWCVYAVWPHVAPRPAPPPPMLIDSPVTTALIGTAIVMPLMLVYLLFGLADALPVLVTTVLLVANFDAQQGTMQGLVMILGNLLGGFVGLIGFVLVVIVPSLVTLALFTFLTAIIFSIHIEKGGARAAIALLTCNSSLIILSTMIASPSTSSGVWVTRLFQFALACAFAVGMMSLVWRKQKTKEQLPTGSRSDH